MSNEPSGAAVGWTFFAAIMLMVVGVFQVIAGIAAIAEDDLYVKGPDWVAQFDVTTWGWIHLIVGIVLVVSGFGILSGNLAARIVGVIVAALSAIANFAFLPWYPVWSIVIIAVDVAVIWALTAHGRDIQMTE
ncbi:MAG: hypothetical protein R3A49_12330 [Acidimicrobiia bacterium]